MRNDDLSKTEALDQALQRIAIVPREPEREVLANAELWAAIETRLGLRQLGRRAPEVEKQSKGFLRGRLATRVLRTWVDAATTRVAAMLFDVNESQLQDEEIRSLRKRIERAERERS